MPVIHSGGRVASGKNVVCSVAVGAGRGVFTLSYGLAVHAVDVLLNRMREGHSVAGEEASIAVALGAGHGDLLFGYGRSGLG